MRGLTASEMGCVAGGSGVWDDPSNPLGGGDTVYGHPQGGVTSFGDDPAHSGSTGGNGSGNNGISPTTGQKLIDTLMGAGSVTDPLIAHGAGDMADAAEKAQTYNQATSKVDCEQVQQGTWDPNANNGGGGCKH